MTLTFERDLVVSRKELEVIGRRLPGNDALHLDAALANVGDDEVLVCPYPESGLWRAVPFRAGDEALWVGHHRSDGECEVWVAPIDILVEER